MKRITIGDSERDYDDAAPTWIQEHVTALRSRGMPVCVRVIIKSGDIDMALSTPGCGPGAPGGRPARLKEKDIFELWDKRGLNKDDFQVGQLIAFINQTKRV